MIYNKFDSFRWPYFTAADSPTTRGPRGKCIGQESPGRIYYAAVLLKRALLACLVLGRGLTLFTPLLPPESRPWRFLMARLVPGMAIQDTPHPYLSLCPVLSSSSLVIWEGRGCKASNHPVHLYISRVESGVLTLIAAITGRDSECFMPGRDGGLEPGIS